MVIMVQKKGVRFPQFGWHIHRVILHLCIPGSPRRWSAIPEDSVFGYVTKFPITYTPTVGFSSIQIWTMEILGATINVHSERSEFEDRSHGLRVCTHRGPSFSPLKIASLNGHFTVSQVEPGNTIGIDIWMDVYIRGHASFTWEW